jgi:hypothetical protein
MFAGRFGRGTKENAQERQHIVPLTQKASGSSALPPTGTKRKDKSSAVEVSKRHKAAQSPKGAVGISDTPSWGVPIANHTFLNKSTLQNSDEMTAIHYMQGLSSSTDWRTVNSMDNATFTKEFALHMSKVSILPVMAYNLLYHYHSHF